MVGNKYQPHQFVQYFCSCYIIILTSCIIYVIIHYGLHIKNNTTVLGWGGHSTFVEQRGGVTELLSFEGGGSLNFAEEL